MVSRFCHFLVGRTRSPDFVISFFLRSPQFGSGCIWLSVCWLCVPLGWGDRLSTPKSRLHHRRPRVLRRKRDCTPPSSSHSRDSHLAHSSEGFDASGKLLGRVWCIWTHLGWGDRLSTPHVHRLLLLEPWLLRRKRDCPPSSAHPRCVHQHCRRVLRRRKDWHLSLPPHIAGLYLGGRRDRPSPHINVDYLGGGGTGPPPHSNDEYFGGGGTGPPPHIDGKFLKCAVVTQLGRSGDTMICVKGTLCTRVQIGTARDVLRHHAAGVWC